MSAAVITGIDRITGSNPIRLHIWNSGITPDAMIAPDVSVLRSEGSVGGSVVGNVVEQPFVLYLRFAMVETPTAESSLQLNLPDFPADSSQEAQLGNPLGLYGHGD